MTHPRTRQKHAECERDPVAYRRKLRRYKLQQRYALHLDAEIERTREKLELLLEIKEYG